MAAVKAAYSVEGVEELRTGLVEEVWLHLRLLLANKDFEEYMCENGELGSLYDVDKDHGIKYLEYYMSRLRCVCSRPDFDVQAPAEDNRL